MLAGRMDEPFADPHPFLSIGLFGVFVSFEGVWLNLVA